jgi:hypothetical protein
MPTYVVTRKSDGTEVNRYTAAAPIEWAGWEFATHEHAALPEEPAPAPPPAPPVRITRLAFLNRFTDAEAIQFDLASMGANPQAAAMRRYMQKVNAAEFIDLQRTDTRAGVLALAGSLLTAERAAAILDTPPEPHEVFNG